MSGTKLTLIFLMPFWTTRHSSKTSPGGARFPVSTWAVVEGHNPPGEEKGGAHQWDRGIHVEDCWSLNLSSRRFGEYLCTPFLKLKINWFPMWNGRVLLISTHFFLHFSFESLLAKESKVSPEGFLRLSFLTQKNRAACPSKTDKWRQIQIQIPKTLFSMPMLAAVTCEAMVARWQPQRFCQTRLLTWRMAWAMGHMGSHRCGRRRGLWTVPACPPLQSGPGHPAKCWKHRCIQQLPVSTMNDVVPCKCSHLQKGASAFPKQTAVGWCPATETCE